MLRGDLIYSQARFPATGNLPTDALSPPIGRPQDLAGSSPAR